MKYGPMTWGQMEAVINKLGGMEGVQRFLAGETAVLEAMDVGKDCFRLTDDEVAIEMPALKRPTLSEVEKDWSSVRAIESDTSTEDPVTLRLGTMLTTTEDSINGAIYELRIKKLRTDGRILGFQHRAWLLKNQDTIADPKVRSALNALLGKIYIDFSGIVVMDDDGFRRIPNVSYGGERWNGYWHWLGDDFRQDRRMAVSLGRSQMGEARK